MYYHNLVAILKVALVRLLHSEWVYMLLGQNKWRWHTAAKSKMSFLPQNLTLFERKSLWNDFIETPRVLKSIIKHLIIIHTKIDAKK